MSYPDKNGVEFESVRGMLGPVRDWPRRGPLVKDPAVTVEWKRARQQRCWFCDATIGGGMSHLAAHHIVGGQGRSDEETNYVLACDVVYKAGLSCHAAIHASVILLGRVLYEKWERDRETVDWIRLCLLRGSFLPELEA